MRSLAEIAKEQQEIAKLWFNKPIIKTTKDVFYKQEPVRNAKRYGTRKPKQSKMIGEVK